MKKILFIFLIFVNFVTNVKAVELQEELLINEDNKFEYHYRFYKERIEGEYIKVGMPSNYQYIDEDNIRYGGYSSYQKNCQSEEGVEIEYATKYVYQKLFPMQHLKITNTSKYSLKLSNIEFVVNDIIVNYKVLYCYFCSDSSKTIHPGGYLVLKLEYPIDFIDLKLLLEFTDVRNTQTYELSFLSEKEYSSKNHIAFIMSDTNTKEYEYNSKFYLYYYDTSTYIGNDFEVDEVTKILSEEQVCRTRELLSYRYNIFKDYYDNNYYKDVTDLLNLTKEQQDEYKKDFDDYKIIYMNKEYSEDVNEDISLKLVKTGVEKREYNYKFLILYVLVLAIIGLFLLNYIKIMSNEKDD